MVYFWFDLDRVGHLWSHLDLCDIPGLISIGWFIPDSISIGWVIRAFSSIGWVIRNFILIGGFIHVSSRSDGLSLISFDLMGYPWFDLDRAGHP